MSKYYKAEDIMEIFSDESRPENWMGTETEIQEQADFDFYKSQIESLPTIEVSEENDFKFYYVESIDDYWIGKRSDNFYYAEWRGDYFVWTHSRYLPWGEHIVDENTLWKEHTYPSEPIEISFSEWIVGFMKKHGSKVSEDAISRKWLLNFFVGFPDDYTLTIGNLRAVINDAPSVVPTTEQSSIVGERKDK